MAGSVTVFGGTGFIGRHLVARFLRSGKTVRVAVRHPGRIQMATVSGQPAELIQADVLDDVGVGAAIAGVDAVVNLVGILTQTTTQTYRAIHVEGAPASCAGSTAPWRDAPDPHIGSRRQPDIAAISDQTKAKGEQAVRAVFPQATIVRPSLTFGEDDHFFSGFAALIKRSPVLPLIGGGTTKFQPVFVDEGCWSFSSVLKPLAKPTNLGVLRCTASRRSWNFC